MNGSPAGPMDAKHQPTYLVDPYGEPVAVRVVGRASFQNCASLKQFLQHMELQRKRAFLLDFAGCTSMDSTFLGVLVGFALRLRKATPPGTLTLARLGPRNHELVRNLGLHRLVQVTGSEPPQRTLASQPLAPAPAASEIDNARLVLEAHENLVEIDEANATRFQDVIAFLKNRVEQG